MRALLDVILLALQLYTWLLVAAAILSWLIVFNVVNTRNQFVGMISDFLYRITEPALRLIRPIHTESWRDRSFVRHPLLHYHSDREDHRLYIYPNVF